MNKQSAILTEQDFRAAISSQCGFGALSSDELDSRVSESIRTVINRRMPLLMLKDTPERHTVESEADYNERMDEREQDRYEQQEAQ
jgi:hypothetical protein